jgi:hypothetical protein
MIFLLRDQARWLFFRRPNTLMQASFSAMHAMVMKQQSIQVGVGCLHFVMPRYHVVG